jgi:hypothetical protein
MLYSNNTINLGRIRELAQKILVTPWELDSSLYCTPPRAYSESIGRKNTIKLQERRRSLFGCVSSDHEATMLTADIQQQCLPIDLRGDRRVLKMVRDKKRKLFHTQIYEDELEMKKLYIQSAKKLPGYGNKFRFKKISQIKYV